MVSYQNGVSLLYIMLELDHFGQEPSKYGVCSSDLKKYCKDSLKSLEHSLGFDQLNQKTAKTNNRLL